MQQEKLFAPEGDWFLTCIGAGGQATLVKSLQEEPTNFAAWPTTQHAGNDVIETQEGNSALGGQVSQDEAGLLHLSLNSTECRVLFITVCI